MLPGMCGFKKNVPLEGTSTATSQNMCQNV